MQEPADRTPGQTRANTGAAPVARRDPPGTRTARALPAGPPTAASAVGSGPPIPETPQSPELHTRSAPEVIVRSTVGTKAHPARAALVTVRENRTGPPATSAAAPTAVTAVRRTDPGAQIRGDVGGLPADDGTGAASDAEADPGADADPDAGRGGGDVRPGPDAPGVAGDPAGEPDDDADDSVGDSVGGGVDRGVDGGRVGDRDGAAASGPAAAGVPAGPDGAAVAPRSPEAGEAPGVAEVAEVPGAVVVLAVPLSAPSRIPTTVVTATTVRTVRRRRRYTPREVTTRAR